MHRQKQKRKKAQHEHFQINFVFIFNRLIQCNYIQQLQLKLFCILEIFQTKISHKLMAFLISIICSEYKYTKIEYCKVEYLVW